MSKLLLPKEEIAKALDTFSYQGYLHDHYDLKGCDMLVERVYQGEKLTQKDYAPLLEDGQKMASFMEGLLEQLPEQVMQAFSAGWNPHGIERGRQLIEKFVTAAAALPEGPFFYLLAEAYGNPTLMASKSDADDWNELFSGAIVGMIDPQYAKGSMPALASERLQGLADLAVAEETIRGGTKNVRELSDFDKAIVVQRTLKGELTFTAVPSSETDEVLRALKAKDAAYAVKTAGSDAKPH